MVSVDVVGVEESAVSKRLVAIGEQPRADDR